MGNRRADLLPNADFYLRGVTAGSIVVSLRDH
jgi:hypothetical protein